MTYRQIWWPILASSQFPFLQTAHEWYSKLTQDPLQKERARNKTYLTKKGRNADNRQGAIAYKYFRRLQASQNCTDALTSAFARRVVLSTTIVQNYERLRGKREKVTLRI